jgi:hypothetical protein
MSDTLNDLRIRIDRLERESRRRRQRTVALVVGMTALWLGTSMGDAQDARVVRVRALIVEDENGRDRIVIGAPVPDPKEGRRVSSSVGLVINDPNGLERFGVGLQENGRMVMGFDAPPGTGDPRNRERINIVADATGGAYIRFLNRKTFVPGRLVLDDEDRFYLELLDFPEGKTISRRIGFKGDETVEQPR